MPTLPERLKAAKDSFSGSPPGLGPPGLNPLFFGVLGAIALAAVAAITAGGGPEIVQSNLVYRLVVGGIVGAILYGVVVVVWLAWHRRALKKLNVVGTGAETPSQGTEAEVSARDEEIKEFMETTTKAVEDLDRRVRNLES